MERPISEKNPSMGQAGMRKSRRREGGRETALGIERDSKITRLFSSSFSTPEGGIVFRSNGPQTKKGKY